MKTRKHYSIPDEVWENATCEEDLMKNLISWDTEEREITDLTPEELQLIPLYKKYLSMKSTNLNNYPDDLKDFMLVELSGSYSVENEWELLRIAGEEIIKEKNKK